MTQVKNEYLMSWVFIVDNDPGKTKVRHLGYQVLSYENVSCRQIPVDQAFPLQMRHTMGNLKILNYKKNLGTYFCIWQKC